MLKNDLVGQRFGRLTAIELLQESATNGCRLWLCRCDCGNTKTVPRKALVGGTTKSCGCLQRDHASQLTRTHGMSNSPEWSAWHMLKDRCNNPSSHAYNDYGGRGIKVDASWNESFEKFFEDVGPRPGPEYSIDRRDVNGHYEPGNVRWVTGSVQQLNRRPSKRNQLGVVGVSPMKDGRFLAQMRVNGVPLLNRTFDTLDEAITARRQKELEVLGHSLTK